MSEKIVSQLNSDGYFIAPTRADESPLEPGIYLIPAGAVDCQPPAIPEGKRARWTGIKFVLEDTPPPPEPEPQPEPPPPGPPQSVTRAQAKLALHAAGLLPQVEAIMSNPETPLAYRIAWSDALTFERSSPTMAALAGLLGLDAAALDALFVSAASVVV